MTNDEAALQLSADQNYRVLRRLEVRDHFFDREDEPIVTVIILDCESTGLTQKKDKMVELGMLAIEVGALTGRCYRVIDVYNELEQPGIPMPPETTAINHITDEMLIGKKFDDARVAEIVAGAELVIAHNAEFDRGMAEARFPEFEKLAWACSLKDIPWKAIGFSASSLEFIGLKSGFFFEGHRAEIDCRALLEVLRQENTEGVTLLKSLLDSAKDDLVRLWALNAPYDKKDNLKGRGYKWSDGNDGKPKAWHITLTKTIGREEVLWLSSEIYKSPSPIRVDILDAASRFSERVKSTQLFNTKN